MYLCPVMGVANLITGVFTQKEYSLTVKGQKHIKINVFVFYYTEVAILSTMSTGW